MFASASCMTACTPRYPSSERRLEPAPIAQESLRGPCMGSTKHAWGPNPNPNPNPNRNPNPKNRRCASHSRTPRDGSSSTAPRCQPLPAFLEGQSRTHLDESCPLWSDPDARRGEAHISPPVTSSLVTSSQLCPDPHRPSAALAVLFPTGLACLLAHQVAGSPCWSLEAGSGGFCNRMRGLAVKQCYCRNDSVGTRKTTQVSEPGLLASVRQCSSATRSPFPPSRTGEHPPPPISHYPFVCT